MPASQSDFLQRALPLLLHDHDCLVVPGLGGFVAHPVSASYDEQKSEWIPPGRNVRFNPKLLVRDGLFEQEIRRATGCSHDAAAALIDREVAELSKDIDASGHATIPGLGRLFRTEEGSLSFAAEPRLGERYAAPGLHRIPWPDLAGTAATDSEEAPSVADSTPPSIADAATESTGAPIPVSEAEESTEPASAFSLQPWLRAAAILALPLIVAGSLIWQNQGHTGFSLSIFDAAGIPATYTPRIEGEDIRFSNEDSQPLPFLSDGAPNLPLAEEETMPVPIPGSTADGCTLYVIAGTFSETWRAAELARRLESLGFAPSILPGPEDMKRVSAGCFLDTQEAQLFRLSLQSLHGQKQAWILRL